MVTSRSVAAAQTVPVAGDVEANTGQHVDLVRMAGVEGARMVAFPELSLTGYELERGRELAFTEGDDRLTPLIEVVRETDVIAIVGAPVRLEKGLHIGAFVISPAGVEVYTKHRLGAFSPSDNPGGSVPPPEDSVFLPGNCDPLVPVGNDLAGLAVCADMGSPAHAAHAAARGAGIYVVGAFVIPTDLDQDVGRLHGYAVDHAMVVVLSNFGGPSGGLPTAGSTSIWSPDGERVVQLPERGVGLAIAFEDEGRWRGRMVAP